MTDFPTIAPRGHRPRLGKQLRVPFPGCTVAPITLLRFDAMCVAAGTSRGLVLDRLVNQTPAIPTKTKRHRSHVKI